MCLGTILCYIIKDHFFNASFIKGECNNPEGFLLSKILLELLFCYSREMAIILMFFQHLRVAFTKKTGKYVTSYIVYIPNLIVLAYSNYQVPNPFQFSPSHLQYKNPKSELDWGRHYNPPSYHHIATCSFHTNNSNCS